MNSSVEIFVFNYVSNLFLQERYLVDVDKSDGTGMNHTNCLFKYVCSTAVECDDVRSSWRVTSC